MTDREFINCAEGILNNARECCRQMLELADLVGESRAFNQAHSDLGFPRELMRRMLYAANDPAGASNTELFAIAGEVEKHWIK